MEQTETKSKLTASERARIELKRLEALERKRKADMKRNSIDLKLKRTKPEEIVLVADTNNECGLGKQSYGERVIDTDAGFLLKTGDNKVRERRYFEPKVYEEEYCEECQAPFRNSELRDNFDCLICDACYDSEKYPLMTKSEAIKEYLLTDKLLTRKGLKCKLKKNPHYSAWGTMKLYLICQLEKLALEEWESWEKLDEEKERRKIKSAQMKQKNFDKKIKKMRQDIQRKAPKKRAEEHEHDFTKIEDLGNDNFRKTCDCGFSSEYEVM